jgi:DNA-binding transcriptional ArsR family regulator
MNILVSTFEGKKAASKSAAAMLRALAHPCRLQVLCALAEKEYCVTDLMKRTHMSQSALSQHLARLRQADIVATRRDAQTIYYRVAKTEALDIINVLSQAFCPSLSTTRSS